MTDPDTHGCMIDGQPAMPILISEYNALVAQVAEAEASARRALEQRQEMAEERYIWQQRGDRAEAAVGRVRALADRWVKAGPPPLGTPIARWVDRRLVELNTALAEPAPATTQATDEHVYLSTGCLYGDHGYCQGMTGMNGAKRPGECKHCGARCVCGCHAAAKEPTP